MAKRILLITKEQWKSVAGFSDYEISSFGQIRSYKWPGSNKKFRVIPKLLTPKLGPRGYLSIGLRDAMRQRSYFRISRLVALAFIAEVAGKLQVNHKDGDKLNNQAENLEWVTGSENVQHAHRTGLCHPRRGDDASWAKLTSVQVAEIRSKYRCECVERQGRKRNDCVHENTITQLAEEYGVGSQAIHLVIKGTNWQHVDIA